MSPLVFVFDRVGPCAYAAGPSTRSDHNSKSNSISDLFHTRDKARYIIHRESPASLFVTLYSLLCLEYTLHARNQEGSDRWFERHQTHGAYTTPYPTVSDKKVPL